MLYCGPDKVSAIWSGQKYDDKLGIVFYLLIFRCFQPMICSANKTGIHINSGQ